MLEKQVSGRLLSRDGNEAVTIRKATVTDRESIWAVHVAAIRETCSSHYAPEQIAAWCGCLTPQSYDEVLRTREMLVACLNGEVIGFGQLNAGTGEIQAVYVAPPHHGAGVGSSILAGLEKIAAARGIRRLRLCATLNAVPFYKRNGFERAGDLAYRVTDSIVLACVGMEKQLE